jgi:hypothetical protein
MEWIGLKSNSWIYTNVWQEEQSWIESDWNLPLESTWCLRTRPIHGLFACSIFIQICALFNWSNNPWIGLNTLHFSSLLGVAIEQLGMTLSCLRWLGTSACPIYAHGIWSMFNKKTYHRSNRILHFLPRCYSNTYNQSYNIQMQNEFRQLN